jgi:hypothetical protein
VRENQKASENLMREILRENYLELRVESHVLEEDIVAGSAKIRATVAPTSATVETKKRTIEGQGVGLVDAFYHGLVGQYSIEYPSLKSIRFVGFALTGMLDRAKPRSSPSSDAVGEVRLLVENSEGNDFEFTASSRSITACALQATLDAVEYFVNSERAFLMTHVALSDAKTRSRSDLVQKFSGRLAELVRNTSYSEAIEAARKGKR